MTHAQTGNFACPTCGHQFTWTEALAGLQVRCTCGAVFRCPSEPTQPEGDYDLAPQPLATKPPRTVPPTHTPQPPTNRPAIGGSLPRGNIAARPSSVENTDVEKIKSLYAPLWLLGGGIFVELVAMLLRYGTNLTGGAVAVVIPLVVTTALNLAGVSVAAKLRQIDLGSFGSAVLRLAAVCVGTQAVMELLHPVLGFVGRFAAVGMIPLGPIIAAGVQFILYFTLLGALFDLDQEDTWYCVCVIFVISVGCYFLFHFLAPGFAAA
jgi:hypothetical protein